LKPRRGKPKTQTEAKGILDSGFELNASAFRRRGRSEGGPVKNLRISPSTFWLSDPMLVALLVALCVFIFLLPILELPDWGVASFRLVAAIIMLSGIVVLSRGRLELIVGASLAASAIVVLAVDALLPDVTLEAWDAGLLGLAEAALAYLILAHVFRDGPITKHRIAGAVAVYLLLGQIWVHLYMLICVSNPGAFHFVSAPASSFELWEKLIYYSFSTLTTVGFGDVTALRPAARSAALLEALTGQLFPAILIARLVAMEIESRRERRLEKVKHSEGLG
jgi:voltage-gated potassium channel Kch